MRVPFVSQLAVLQLAAIALWCSPGVAQECCPTPCVSYCEGQTYRLVYQTVCEQRQYTAYRVEYDTVCEDQQVTTYRPVWETNYQERRYTVARPVTETSFREEQYTVQRPVYETQYRDCSYDRVRYVSETAEREECYTVQRPVYETQQRQECYTVMKPVTQTTYRTEYQTVMRAGHDLLYPLRRPGLLRHANRDEAGAAEDASSLAVGHLHGRPGHGPDGLHATGPFTGSRRRAVVTKYSACGSQTWWPSRCRRRPTCRKRSPVRYPCRFAATSPNKFAARCPIRCAAW